MRNIKIVILMSIWNLNTKKEEIIELKKDLNVDTLIIGAGMTGLTTAYFLKTNKSICVVDAGLVGHGVTLGTTAKINYFQQTIYTDIMKATNTDNAISYLKSQKDAISLLLNIITEENIQCDLKKTPSYVFASSKSNIKKLDEEIKFLANNNCLLHEGKLPIDIKSYKSYFVEDTYTFNPIKYLYGLYKILKRHNIQIYENSKIINIKKDGNRYICHGENFTIIAKRVVLACHYPYFLLPFLTPLKCSLEKSYIIISRTPKDKNFTAISVAKPLFSCRYYNDGQDIYQISLARSHDIAFDQNDTKHFQKTEKMFKLKKEDIVLKYTNSDIMTPDHMPYIGQIKENLYIAIGYNTWGMTNSIIAAKIISDSIIGKKNEYEQIFTPSRNNVSKLIKTPIYIAFNTKSFLGSKIYKNKKWYSDRVKFYKEGNTQLACYTDEEGKKYIVKNKCPHLGCSLNFNETELTWDCPCHSSRFDLNGNCIKGPSTKNIKYKEE